jgi:hypothetical protein
MDGASSVAPKGRKKRKSKTAKSANGDHEDGKAAGQDEELFVVDKIIAESVDVNGETIYKVLWVRPAFRAIHPLACLISNANCGCFLS